VELMEYELMEIAKWFLQLKYRRNKRGTGSRLSTNLTLEQPVMVWKLAIPRRDPGWPISVLEAEWF
jgi:hypothetical protein